MDRNQPAQLVGSAVQKPPNSQAKEGTKWPTRIIPSILKTNIELLIWTLIAQSIDDNALRSFDRSSDSGNSSVSGAQADLQ